MKLPELGHPVDLINFNTNYFSQHLNTLWTNRVGRASDPDDELIFYAVDFMTYRYKSWSVLFLLKQLILSNIIPNSPIFLENGDPNPNASQSDYDNLFMSEHNPGILHNLNVVVIGGHEAEIFAALGAEAVGVDPHLYRLPPHRWSNLHEISDNFSDEFTDFYRNYFDISFSNQLFSWGSTLCHADAVIADYQKYLMQIIAVTKSKGISVHNGERMPGIIQSLDQTHVRVLDIKGFFEGEVWGNSDVFVALQKK
jgi:hypothetical protein